MAAGQRDSILSHDCLSGRGVCCHHDAVALLEAVDGALLKLVQLEVVLDGGVRDQLVEVFHIEVIFDHPVFILLLCELLKLYLLGLVIFALFCHDSKVEARRFSLDARDAIVSLQLRQPKCLAFADNLINFVGLSPLRRILARLVRVFDV